MNKTFKRYAISTLITFGAGFSIAILPELNSLTLGSLQNGVLGGIFFAAVRAGIKAVIELFIGWYQNRKIDDQIENG